MLFPQPLKGLYSYGVSSLLHGVRGILFRKGTHSFATMQVFQAECYADLRA
jgi:hypothetical protein